MTRRLVLRRVRYYFAPVGLVHLGVALALVGALCASVLDSYGQRVLSLPRDLGSVHRFPDGYRLRIELGRASREADGGYAPAGIAYRAVTQVALEVEEGGSLLDLGTGQTLYRDARQSPGSLGPVRQICAIVDYRYGRYAGDPGYALDPFIHRGLWRDVQVWVPGADFGGTAGDELELPVVIKTFPMMSWLWGGLAIALAASALIVLGAYLPSRSASRPAPPRSSGAPRA